MPNEVLSFAIAGGFNTNSGPVSTYMRDANGQVVIPWLMRAENCEYNLDGWPQKMRGASAVNTVATGATDAVMGIFDYWKQGTAGTPVQKRVIYASASIYKDDADGVWDSLKGGLETAKTPAFAVMNDKLILATNSNTDVPQIYNQTVIADLGGTPPNFAFHVEHKGRLFAAGVAANPSRLYYCVFNNPENWTGVGSGSIDVYSDDGDQITGLASHNDELVIFKGPNHGRIVRLIGASPTGAEAFSLVPMVRGVGATSHQSIIVSGRDLVWWDHHGIHSLVATAQFGDYLPSFLSHDITDYFLGSLNHSRFSSVGGQNFSTRGMALWTCSLGGSSTHDVILGMDYRFRPARFFLWPAYAVASIGIVHDGVNGRIPWVGTYTGFVMRTNRPDRHIAHVGYQMSMEFPYVPVADAFFDIGVTKGRVSYEPKGTATFRVGWRRDRNTLQTETITQDGSAVLGPATGEFVLDTDTLAGGDIQTKFFDMSGTFKEIQLSILSEASANADCEPHGLAIEVAPHGVGTTETLG